MSNMHVLVAADSPDALKVPSRTTKLATFMTHYEIHQLLPPKGYVCLGDILIKKSEKIDISKYCCVREDLTVTGIVRHDSPELR